MIIKPYGDTLNDGSVQLSFTLPIKDNPQSREAARLLVQKMGFGHVEIVHSQSLSDNFTFFVAYGKTQLSIDLNSIVVEENIEEEYMNFNEINTFIEEKIKRKIVIIGACTGFDAHTVGIDAIMNMKGYNHHYGLERYPMIDAYNLGAQVPNEKLIEFAKKVNADAILVSQIVTQKDTHIHNLTEFIEMLELSGLRHKIVTICGGPRINNKFALELGFDIGFGRGTYAEHVATFIVKKMLERMFLS